jgi:NADH-quinone oxidoreductase subunit N
MSFDLILLYLAIEIQSISFYILGGLKKNSAFSTEAGLKYFILGALASGLFLFGCSLIYGITGTTNFKDLAHIFISFQNEPLLIVGSLCILFAIFFKLSVAPFHIWSPDIYEGAPSIVTAFFSITPKLGIFIVLIRFFNEIFYDLTNIVFWWEIFGVFCAFLSIFIGSLTALQQTRIKRLLAYSAIGHVGYSLIGFFSGNIEGIQAVFFYLIFYIITNLCIWGSILSLNKIKFIMDLKNIYFINPFLGFSLLISFFSLAGIPPLAGFLAKLSIFFSALESNLYLLVFLSVFLSVISAFYYLRLIKIISFEKRLIWNFNTITCIFSKFISFIISISFISLFLFFVFPLPLSVITYYLSLLCF